MNKKYRLIMFILEIVQRNLVKRLFEKVISKISQPNYISNNGILEKIRENLTVIGT